MPLSSTRLARTGEAAVVLGAAPEAVVVAAAVEEARTGISASTQFLSTGLLLPNTWKK